jgi:glycogen operon protein
LSSINLITAHDGMTLADITSYRQRHNLPNGEDNRDGHHNNLSDNAGVEGPTQDDAVQAVRGQWRRALLATLFCSQGIPQLLAGDEFGHSQQGNNNAYCQDNETAWLDWPGADRGLTDFVAALIRLRDTHVALRHAHWFREGEVEWLNPDGTALTVADWEDPQARSFTCLIEVADEGMAATERWLLLFHAGSEPMSFSLPAGRWLHVLNSATALVLPQVQWVAANPCIEDIMLSPRSVFGLVQRLSPTALPPASHKP